MFNNLKELIESMPSEEVCREYLAKQLRQDGQRKALQVKNGEVLATFKNVKRAAEATNCKARHIRKVLMSKRKTSGGFEWYYT